MIVDNNISFLHFIKQEIERSFDCFNIKTFNNPIEAIKELNNNFDLILIDWEMAFLDGKKFIEYAESMNIPFHKIVVISSKNIDELHRHFKLGRVLSVINKSDPQQMKALFMILENIGCN
jgi:CheY-like chemotaxis protein